MYEALQLFQGYGDMEWQPRNKHVLWMRVLNIG